MLLDLWIKQEDKTNGYKLTKLDFGFTKITDQGAKYVSGSLKNDNFKLTRLYLDVYRIESTGVEHLSGG